MITKKKIFLILTLLLFTTTWVKAQLNLPLAGTPTPITLTTTEQTELNTTGLLPVSAVNRANWYILVFGRHRIPLVNFNNYTNTQQEKPVDNMWIRSLAITGDDSQLWTFVGDATRGYLLFNKDSRKPLIMARLPNNQVCDSKGFITFGGKPYYQTAEVQPSNAVGYPFKQQTNDYYARVVFDLEMRTKADNSQNRLGYGNWIMNNKANLFSIKDKDSYNRLVQYPRCFGSAAKTYAEPPSIVGAYLYNFNGTSFSDITLPMAKKHVASADKYIGALTTAAATPLKNAIEAYEANPTDKNLMNAVRSEYTKVLKSMTERSQLYQNQGMAYLITASSIPYTLTRQGSNIMAVRGHINGVAANGKPSWATSTNLEAKVGYFKQQTNFNNAIWNFERYGLIRHDFDTKNAFDHILYFKQDGSYPLDEATSKGFLVYESPEPGFFVMMKKTVLPDMKGISGTNYDLGGRQQEYFLKVDAGSGRIVEGGNGDDGAIYPNSWFALMPINNHTAKFNDEGFATYTPTNYNTLMSENVQAHKVVMANYTNEATIEPIDGDVMSQGTGYVIKGTPGASINIYQTIYDESDTKANILVGTTVSTQLPNRAFVLTQLAKSDGNAYKGNYRTGFYTTKSNTPTIPAGKAYIPLNVGSKAKSFVFPDFTTTHIFTPEWNPNNNNKIFDINGIQQQHRKKGINIINGKKYYFTNEQQ